MYLEQMGQGPPPFLPYNWKVNTENNNHFEKRDLIEEPQMTAISAANGVSDFGERNRAETGYDARKPNDVALGVHFSQTTEKNSLDSNSSREWILMRSHLIRNNRGCRH